MPDSGAATSGLRWAAAQLTSRLWFHVSLFAIGAVATALIAAAVTPWVPDALTRRIDDAATWDILTILASSMLVVATFSLGTMVSAYSAVASLATPRATRILIDDPFSQNVLATFLGAFVFAMVGLLALGLNYYSPAGRAVLLLAAAFVILIVIGTFFAWLDHLANLVRLGETLRKLEVRAAQVLRARAAEPLLGGVRASDAARAEHAVPGVDTLYVQHLDMGALQAIAVRAGGRITVGCPPGALAGPTRPLAWTSWAPDEADRDAIRRAFVLGVERSFDQDPRFCLEVVAEIGSRALSPGLNDPGTAIGVLAAQQRLLTAWAESAAAPAPQTRLPNVAFAPVTTAELFEDAFGPLARDGARLVEVALRLQKTLAALAELGHPDFAREARRASERALAYADQGLAVEADRTRIREAAARVVAAR